MSIDSAFSQSDVKEAFKDICMGNMNKSIFVHLNIYSLRNKSDLLKKKKGFHIYSYGVWKETGW